MEKLISPTLAEALNNQIVHERYNATLYLYVAGYLKNKGLENLAKIFEEQHEEESSHAKMIFNLLTDMNTPVILGEVDGVAIQFESILDIAKLYLEREVFTTASLDEIKNLAIEEKNPIVEEHMRKMIKLQQKEYAESTDFMDKAEMTGGDWKFVLMWDLGIK